MIGGPERSILVFLEEKAGIPTPVQINLQSGAHASVIKPPPNTTCIMSSGIINIFKDKI